MMRAQRKAFQRSTCEEGRLKSDRGFTLIEVLLSVAILASLSVLAARSIQQAVKAKAKLQDQIDDVSKMRDALRLIERDVNLAYHHRDFEKELDDLVKKPATASTPPAGGFTPPPQQEQPKEAPRKDPATHFVGTDEAMSFVTMNSTRMMKDERQADFIEVGYALKDCRSSDGKSTSKCLWRRSANVVDDDVTLGGEEIVLLENVTEFGLEYIGKGKQDWVKQWRTDKGGDAVSKDNFPLGVRISMTVRKGDSGKGKKYSMQIVVPIHFPNNKEEEKNANPTPGAAGIPGATPPPQ